VRIRTSIFAVILVLLALVWTGPSHAIVEISGDIDGDTTWTNLETILVTGKVTVENSGSLVIEAGTVVLFAPGTGLEVYGELTADGTKSRNVFFTSSADTAGGSPEAGSWTGIWFKPNSTGLLNSSTVLYGVEGVHIYQSSPQIDRCTIENFLNTGISINGALAYPLITPVIRNCVVGQSGAGLIGTGVGIYVYYNVNVTISGCIVSECLYGLEFYGSGSYRPFFAVTDCEIRDHTQRGIYAHSGG